MSIHPGAAADELVTGEAVAIDMPAATLGLRALSGVLDVVIALMLMSTVGMMVLAPFAASLDGAAVAAVYLVLMVTFLIGLPTFLEARYGKTLAKMIVGLRTVRDDGGPITFRHALTRHLVGFVEIYSMAGSPALVSGVLNSRSKRLGDLAAGTYVVRDRMRSPYPKRGVVPPPLAAWAVTADIAPLPDQLALAIRELLSRAPQIRPEHRARLATTLAAQAQAYTSPGPPIGTPPEVFLEALLVERGRRDWERLWREEGVRRRLVPTAPPSPPVAPGGRGAKVPAGPAAFGTAPAPVGLMRNPHVAPPGPGPWRPPPGQAPSYGPPQAPSYRPPQGPSYGPPQAPSPPPR